MNYFKSMRIAPILPHFDELVKVFSKLKQSIQATQSFHASPFLRHLSKPEESLRLTRSAVSKRSVQTKCKSDALVWASLSQVHYIRIFGGCQEKL
jgi:hypothetical protein